MATIKYCTDVELNNSGYNRDLLKFRVWYKPNECYIDINDGDVFYIEPNGRLTLGVYDGDVDDMRYLREEDVIVERCTGLKDKNGELIYEGDVVVVTGDCMTIPTKLNGAFAKVIWDLTSFCFYFPKENEEYFSECWEYEVVGNVHEDSNLLE